MITVKMFEKEDIKKVIEFEYELRKQEPNTYYWEPDENYVKQLEESFSDERFNTAVLSQCRKCFNSRYWYMDGYIRCIDTRLILYNCDMN